MHSWFVAVACAPLIGCLSAQQPVAPLSNTSGGSSPDANDTAPHATATSPTPTDTRPPGEASICDLRLIDFWATSAETAWAVAASGSTRRVVARWDGTRWTAVPVPSTSDVLSVWATSASDVWVSTADGGVLRSNDASSWTVVLAPDASRLSRGARFELDGKDQDDVWIGDMHWDGASWREHPLPKSDRWSGWRVVSVGQQRAFAHFLGGCASFDGAAWSWFACPSPGNAVTPAGDWAVSTWAGAPDDVWLVGTNRLGDFPMLTTDHVRDYLAHGSDDTWTFHFVQKTRWWSVSGTSSCDVWLAGEREWRHFDGAVWTTAEPAPITDCAGCFVSAHAVPGAVFAYTVSGAISLRTESGWRSVLDERALAALLGCNL
jgi:hypothetical protein